MNEKDAMPPYSEARLLNFLLARTDARGDRQLAQRLGVSHSIICAIRAERMPLSGLLLIRMADCANCAVDDLRFVLGDRRRRIRLSCPTSVTLPAQHGGIVRACGICSEKPSDTCRCPASGLSDERRGAGAAQEAVAHVTAMMHP